MLPDRYNKKDANKYDLQSYFIDSQLYNGEDIRTRCHKILDYLYKIVPNDKDNAVSYLQIQRMDLRTAQAIKIDDTTTALVPTITGEAEKVTIENEKLRQPENELALMIKACNEKLSKNEFRLRDCLETIDQLKLIRKKANLTIGYDSILISLFTFALNDPSLDNGNRAGFCQMWIDGIKSYFSNESFIYEYKSSVTLFA